MKDPAIIVNRVLDELGLGVVIGSIYDGTREAEAARRVYGDTVRGLLRTANWSWARRRAPLQLLGDATLVDNAVSSFVEAPWRYAYAWPIDGVRVRWVPWSGIPPSQLAAPQGNIPLPGNILAIGSGTQVQIPIMPNLGASELYPYDRPARFLVTSTDQYPTQVGAPLAWDEGTGLESVEGVGPVNRRIVLTNVQNAQCVYTYLALDIEVWDTLFINAIVAVLGSLLAMPLIAGPNPDPAKLQHALTVRRDQIAIAKRAIGDARVASAQEAGWPMTTDQIPDWIRIRRAGPARWWFYGPGQGPGYLYGGWESFGFGDGSVF